MCVFVESEVARLLVLIEATDVASLQANYQAYVAIRKTRSSGNFKTASTQMWFLRISKQLILCPGKHEAFHRQGTRSGTSPTIRAKFGYREVAAALDRDGRALAALRRDGFYLGHPTVVASQQGDWEEFLRSTEEITVDPDWDEFVRTADDIN